MLKCEIVSMLWCCALFWSVCLVEVCETRGVRSVMAHFTDLPTEMIVHIFEHIPSRDLWRSVRPVCRLFACIIGDSKMWHLKIRVILSLFIAVFCVAASSEQTYSSTDNMFTLLLHKLLCFASRVLRLNFLR